MIIAGIDPGARKCGFAILEIESLQSFRVVELGVWKFKETDPLGHRLEELYASVTGFLKDNNPRWIGLEKAVSFKNVSSALKLSEVRGVIRLAIHQALDQADSRLLELSPTAVKKSTSGMGQGSKTDIQNALILRFPELKSVIERLGPLSHDAYDALAVAWTVASILRATQARPSLQLR